jgi:uncharacterized protein (TIGR03382 family)
VTVATPRLRAAFWLTAVGVVASLAAGRPEPAAVAAPFAVLALVGLQRRRPGGLEAALRIDRDRVTEGERVLGRLEIQSATASDRLEVSLALPAGLELEQDVPGALVVRPGESRTLEFAIRCARWGAYAAGLLRIRRYDRLRLIAEEYELDVGPPLRVYPREEALRALARPYETQASVGDQVARTKGGGIELAELRPFSDGDDLRSVNWHATARTGELVVNELHPERNTAVVLLLDTFADVGTRANPLDQSVRAAVALTQRYLARRDRVGLLTLGGGIRWIRPASGAAQLHRILDTLLNTRAIAPPRGEGQARVHIQTRTIPPQALVLALSPLLENAILDALLELRGRGFDVAVVEIPALPYLELGEEEATVAARFLELERDLLRSSLRARGIAVTGWTEGGSLEATIRAMEEFRRRARVVRA